MKVGTLRQRLRYQRIVRLRKRRVVRLRRRLNSTNPTTTKDMGEVMIVSRTKLGQQGGIVGTLRQRLRYQRTVRLRKRRVVVRRLRERLQRQPSKQLPNLRRSISSLRGSQRTRRRTTCENLPNRRPWKQKQRVGQRQPRKRLLNLLLRLLNRLGQS